MLNNLSFKTAGENIPLKDVKIKPKGLNVTDIAPASETSLDLYRRIKQHQHNLGQIKDAVEAIKRQYETERERTERESGKVPEMEALQTAVQELSAIIGTTEQKLMDMGTEVAYLRDEEVDKPFKPTDSWQLQKIMEKFDKNGEITKYLEAAVNGAQSLATKVKEKELILFPHPERRPRPFMSSLTITAALDGLLEALNDIYENLMSYLKGVESAVGELSGSTELLPVVALLSMRGKLGSRIMKVKETAGFSYSIVDDSGKEIERGFTHREDAEAYLKRLNVEMKDVNRFDPEGFPFE